MMTSEQLQQLRTQLQEERARICGNVDSLEWGLATSLSDETEEHGLESHIADQGTDLYMRERDRALADHEQQLISEIDAALARMDAGVYGTCEVSGESVPFERLQAIPWARTMVEHSTVH